MEAIGASKGTTPSSAYRGVLDMPMSPLPHSRGNHQSLSVPHLEVSKTSLLLLGIIGRSSLSSAEEDKGGFSVSSRNQGAVSLQNAKVVPTEVMGNRCRYSMPFYIPPPAYLHQCYRFTPPSLSLCFSLSYTPATSTMCGEGSGCQGAVRGIVTHLP